MTDWRFVEGEIILIRYILFVLACLALLLAACGEGEEQDSSGSAPTQGVGQFVMPTLPPPPNYTPPPTSQDRHVPIAVDDPRFPIASDPAGRVLYETNCAECHGLNGEGQDPSESPLITAPPHNNDGHTWHHPDQQNFAAVYLGRHIDGTLPMPAFGDKLSQDEIFAILAYIKTWWGQDELAMQAESTRAFATQ